MRASASLEFYKNFRKSSLVGTSLYGLRGEGQHRR